MQEDGGTEDGPVRAFEEKLDAMKRCGARDPKAAAYHRMWMHKDGSEELSRVHDDEEDPLDLEAVDVTAGNNFWNCSWSLRQAPSGKPSTACNLHILPRR